MHYLVIQRCVGSFSGGASDGERDVAEQEGLGPCIVVVLAAFKVLGRAQEPEEGDNDEVDEDGVEGPIDFMVGVEDVHEGADDGNVGRIGSSGWIVLGVEPFEESSEYWIVGFVSRVELAGIRLTQVGDALTHRLEGVSDRITSDIVVGAVAVAKDKEVAEAVLSTTDISEGSRMPVLVAKGFPLAEVSGVGFACFAGVGAGGELQSEAEVSAEACLGAR